MKAVQLGLRRALASVRANRIAPSSINAPPSYFVPQSLGVGTLTVDSEPVFGRESKTLGLQEARLERDAWRGIEDALSRLHQFGLSNSRSQADQPSEDVSMG